MRVLIATGIYPPQIGGPATYSKILAEELPERGVETVVVSFDEVRKYPKVIRHILYFFKILNRSRNSDIIYAQDPVSTGFPAMLAAKVLRAKFVVKIVGDYAWEQAVLRFGEKRGLDEFYKLGIRKSFFVKILFHIQKLVSQKASLIVVPSNYLKKIVSWWGIDVSKIKVIYNSFDISIRQINKLDLKKKLGINSKNLIFSAGRFVPWKRFDFLIEHLSSLLNNDTVLFIAGDGPLKKNLEEKIKTLKLEESVKLLGRLDKKQIQDYLGAADVFVSGSTYEGFPHLILESAVSGTSVIAMKVGGNFEIIEDKKNGILIEENDSEGLLKAVKEILDNPSKGRELAKEAQYRLELFSKTTMVEGLLRHFSSLAQRHKNG